MSTAFGISRLSLVQRFGGCIGSKPDFSIGRREFATGAAALEPELAFVDYFGKKEAQRTSCFFKTNSRLAIVGICMLHLSLSISWCNTF
jgi:hypothetical protein